MIQKVRRVRRLSVLRHLSNAQFLLAVACLLTGSVVAPIAYASSLQNQINSLENQSNQSQSSLNALQLQAGNYQDALNQIQAQISAIQVAIQASQAKQSNLQVQIQNDAQQIAYQKQVLGSYIKAIYVNGQMTTVEELATSQSLSDFVDAQTYRNAVQNQIQTTLAQINALQAQQLQEKTQVDQLLQTQKAQQSQLNSDQAQQAQLLAYNQSQQTQYNQQIAADQSEISALKAEQAAAYARVASQVNVSAGSGKGLCALSGSSSQGTGPVAGNGIAAGNYPDAWCNAPQDTVATEVGSNTNRECTSFAYWYFVNVEGNTTFSASGNGGAWWETSNYPAVTWQAGVKVGALGVEPGTVPENGLGAPVPSLHGSYYGHVMVVVALPGSTYDGVSVPSGDVMVASMNEDEAGHFMYNLWPVDYLMFINPQ